jgi:uncharacterized protein (DUF952 family)
MICCEYDGEKGAIKAGAGPICACLRNIMTHQHPAVIIYKICPAALWREAQDQGVFRGAPIDLADRFIHFSTAKQVQETAAKHFAGQGELLLLYVNTARLGDRLKWEPSRGGAPFPHLYGPLDLTAVTRIELLPLGPDGKHRFPTLLA